MPNNLLAIIYRKALSSSSCKKGHGFAQQAKVKFYEGLWSIFTLLVIFVSALGFKISQFSCSPTARSLVYRILGFCLLLIVFLQAPSPSSGVYFQRYPCNKSTSRSKDHDDWQLMIIMAITLTSNVQLALSIHSSQVAFSNQKNCWQLSISIHYIHYPFGGTSLLREKRLHTNWSQNMKSPHPTVSVFLLDQYNFCFLLLIVTMAHGTTLSRNCLILPICCFSLHQFL